ncbi:hypothetical protein AWH56_020875 [Anaerobacillus isosaccharinicus]|uniref:Uncharacterized protein n=1 Tax=Anaerobacillus isosaccharinicus TaxID=1532552 RepID=A0A1S2LNK3_9BACI|nr:hypothetical protein [Anaerobacillus isosaccharinicus]MBA5586637.1 hypothetical protein [Anaerobacillus isosaccharinicus]QOY35129.1 hypothetical protein AWH56_020875 [Anaerobacillus isosaccharinicus]
MLVIFYIVSCIIVGLLTLLIQRKNYAKLGFGAIRGMIIVLVGAILPNTVIYYSVVFNWYLTFNMFHYLVLLFLSSVFSFLISRVVIAKEE